MESPSPLLSTVRDDMTTYVRHLAARVERAVRAVPPEKLWVKPFPFGNSLGTLVLHLSTHLPADLWTVAIGGGSKPHSCSHFGDCEPRPEVSTTRSAAIVSSAPV